MHVLNINGIFSTTYYTYDRCLEVGGKCGPDAWALYTFYCKQSHIQNNKQSFTLNKFVREGLGWGDKRVKNARAVLKKLGLIDDIIVRDEKGVIISHYVRVNYSIDEKDIRTAGMTYGLSTTAPDHDVVTGRCGGMDTNTLNLTSKYPKQNKNAKDSDLSPLELALDEFVEMRKKIKKPLTLQAFKRLSAKLDKLANNDEEKVAILNQSVDHCWQDVYPLKEPLSTEPKTALDFVKFFDKCWEEGSHKTKILDVYGREKYEKIKSLWVSWCATGNVDDSFSL